MTALGVALASPPRSSAQTGEHVAVIINTRSAASVQIGEAYARVRHLPPANIIRIETTGDEQIDPDEYVRSIEAPVATALSRNSLQDRILYIVLTTGTPLRIRGTEGRSGTTASVDSELALLYRRMTGRYVPVTGPVANPYFLGDRALSDAQRFTHRTRDIYLVSRLDGFTVEEALALIDRAQSAGPAGRVVLDQRSGLAETPGDRWLGEAADRLRKGGHGDRVLLEASDRPARGVSDVIGYYSWGSNDPQNMVRRSDLQFLPGALAGTYASRDARTLQPPPDTWAPTRSTSPASAWFAGSPQSLTGDLIRDGVTGVAGNISEPYVDGSVRPDILFPAYLAGFNLVESFYLAIPYLSWQTVVIGDPLCAPWQTAERTEQDLDDPIDPETGLPGLFSTRRLSEAGNALKGIPEQAVALMIRAQGEFERGDTADARRSLERATELAPGAAAAQLQLAQMLDEAGDVEQSVVRYRLVLQADPKNVIALNNLAYILAVKQKAPAEGQVLARRAATLAPRSPMIVDTLAWIEHLLGNHREAARLLGPILAERVETAEIYVHAAAIYAALGERQVAERHLDAALRLQPSLADTPDVRALRSHLKSK